MLIDNFDKFEFEFINQERKMQKSRFFPESLRTSTSLNNLYDEDCIREAPEKIGHNKFTKTFCKLQSIPLEGQILNLIPRHIQHLYLSHNKIKSFKGIEQYIHIESLNVSYNSLCQIEELQLFKNPQNMVRIGLKMNHFVYGYQDYVISKFQNLKKLDDLQIGSREKVNEIKTRGQNVANFVLEYYLRMNRVLFFMDDLIQKKMLHKQLKQKNEQKQQKSPESDLKLLFENMSEDFVASVSALYIFPTEQEFRKLSSMQILVKIQKIIFCCLTQEVDLKCSCRPRMPLNEEIKQTFKQISSKFLLRFSSRFNTQIQRGLSIIKQKIKVLHPSRQFQKWQLFGMLQNYCTLKSGGVRYKNIVYQDDPRYRGLIRQNMNAKSSKKQITHHLGKFISSKGQSDKQNQNPNYGINNHKNILIQNQQLADKQSALDDLTIQKRIMWMSGEKQNCFNQKNKKNLNLEFFYERIPMFIFEKNYIEVMLEIVCQKVKQMLTKYDRLSEQILKIDSHNQKYHAAMYANQSYLDNFYNKCSKINLDLQVQNYPGTFNDLQEQMISSTKDKYDQYPTRRDTSSPLKTQRKNIKKYLRDQKVTNQQAMLKSTLVNNSPQILQEGCESGAITTYRPLLQRKDSQISFGLANQEKQQQDNKSNKQIKYQTHSNSQQKFKNNKSSEFSLFSHTNYEIHQINLIYKVFRSLRLRVVKRRKSKTTAIQKSNPKH